MIRAMTKHKMIKTKFAGYYKWKLIIKHIPLVPYKMI